jgi:excisionase family DNA binding protein
MAERELIPLMEAAKRLGISRMTMNRLVREGRFTVYSNPLDKRQRLLDATELRERVQPVPEGPRGKAAA